MSSAYPRVGPWANQGNYSICWGKQKDDLVSLPLGTGIFPTLF